MKRYQIGILIFLLMIPAILGFSGYIYKIGDKISIGRYSDDFDGAITAIGSDEYTLVIDTNIVVTQDVTVPATCGLEVGVGGSLTYQDANVDLTINGPVQAGPYQWIDPNRDWVTFGDGFGNEYNAAWWGLSSSASAADNYTALNAAVTAANSSLGGTIKIPLGSFSYNSTLSIPANVALIGSGIGRRDIDGPTELNFTGSSGYAMRTTAATGIVGTTIKNIFLTGNATCDGGIHLGDGGTIYNIRYFLEDVQIYDFDANAAVGLWIENPSDVLCNNVYVTGIDDGLALDIDANGVNAGVFTFNNCVFGGSDSLNGASLRSSSAVLDSIVFNACMFGSTAQPLEIGTGGTQARSILFNACHFETYAGGSCTQLIDISSANTNCFATFQTCTYGGAAVADYVFNIDGGSGHREIYIINSDITNIDPNGYILNIATSSDTENYVVLDGFVTITTNPGIATGTGAAEVRIPAGCKLIEFTADDTTPSVVYSDTYQCSNAHTSGCTITNFDDGYKDKLLTVLGNPNTTYYTTISDGGNFKLSSSSWTDESTESITFRYDGTSWYEISRSELFGSTTWDPGNLADGAGETSAGITVTGAALGDFCICSAPYDLQDMIATCYVQAANTVEIRLQNESGSAHDLASGTWKVKIFK